MGLAGYAHYNFQTVKLEEQYNALYNEYEADSRLKCTIGDQTVTFVRNLEIFEIISAFFELLLESFIACLTLETDELTEQRNQAWEVLKERKWIRIIQLDAETPPVKDLEYNLFPEIPPEVTSLIVADFDIPLLGLGSQICKEWQVVCRQDNLWRRFFPSITLPQGIRIKDYCSTRYVHSTDQLIEKVKTFVDSLELNQYIRLIFRPCVSDILQQSVSESNISLMFYKGDCNRFTLDLCEHNKQELFVNNITFSKKSRKLVGHAREGIDCSYYSDFNHVPIIFLNREFRLEDYISQRFDKLEKKYIYNTWF
ncbi:MAG: F-box protein [Parachlamydiaceae bacterium]|nr:F-box protein [Parachlamydiaceae bacterium]